MIKSRISTSNFIRLHSNSIPACIISSNSNSKLNNTQSNFSIHFSKNLKFIQPNQCIESRKYSTEAPQTKNEIQFTEILTKELEAEYVLVNDISGGCGAMYRVQVVSKRFNGIPLVKQHQLVYDCLKEYISGMHGLTMMTKTPAQYEKFKQQKQQA